MLTSLNKYKFIFLIITIIASPLIIFWSIVYGFIVGGIGGVVWGIQKGRNFILSKDTSDERPGLVLAFFQWILFIYIFFFICILAFSVCLFLGPFKAFIKLKRQIKYLIEGTAFKYKRTRPGEKPLVLVVEDEVDLADYVSGKILSTGKYNTVTAHNGREALRVLEKHERFLGIAANRIGCIVLDIKMPEMDGLQFLQELRKREGALMFRDSGSFHQIPVIMLSAYEDVEKISVATHPTLGKAARYIMKPEKPEHYDELLSAVASVFAGNDREMVTSAYINGNYRMNELRNLQE
ncbi:MAG: response regulator [Candidatus Riflemargulisbacteria bacterium]|jgi:CheY-like chemotaxis protein